MDILEGLKSGDPHLRFQALKGACREKPSGYCKAQICQICRNDRYGYNRLQAILALRTFWPETDVIRAITSRLTDEQYIAEAAIRVMGEFSDAKALDALQRAFFTTRNIWVKVNVLRNLAKAPHPLLFAFLRRSSVLTSPDERVRSAAISMLGSVRNKTMKPLFLEKLKDKNDRVRANTIEALPAVCDGKELASVLAKHVRDKNNRVRANAIMLLLQLGVKKADTFLREMVASGNALFRASAAFVLGRVRESDNHRNWLRMLLKDTDDMVQSQAEASAERLGWTDTVGL